MVREWTIKTQQKEYQNHIAFYIYFIQVYAFHHKIYNPTVVLNSTIKCHLNCVYRIVVFTTAYPNKP